MALIGDSKLPVWLPRFPPVGEGWDRNTIGGACNRFLRGEDSVVRTGRDVVLGWMEGGLERLDEETVRGSVRAGAAWAEVFSLPLRGRAWRGVTGGHAGLGTGSSLDFQDHREYQPGDDPRHINWQAYARTGQYTMKQYREEVRPVVDIVMDVSPSMFFLEEKAERSVELLGFAVEAARRAGTSPRVWLADAEGVKVAGWEELESGRWAGGVGGSVAVSKPPVVGRVALRPQSLRVLISDLLYPGVEREVMGWLGAGQARAVVLVPWSEAEADPGWEGNMELVDAEDGGVHPRRIEEATLEQYRRAYARHFEVWKEAAVRHGVMMSRVAAGRGFGEAMQQEALRTGAVETWD